MPCNSGSVRFVVHANMILSAGSFLSSQLIVSYKLYKERSIPGSIIPYRVLSIVLRF
jgi:hypothetical protein